MAQRDLGGRFSPGKSFNPNHSLVSLSSEEVDGEEDDSPFNRMLKEDSQWNGAKNESADILGKWVQ